MQSDPNDQQTPEQVTFMEELYVARCKDTLETPSREEFLRFSSRLKAKVSGKCCSLRNQHLGVSAANTLGKFFRNRNDLVKLDLYCNLIRDHGLQVVAPIVQLNRHIKIFNIGCNDLTDKSAPQLATILQANHLTTLQLGVVEKSLHPNKISASTLEQIAEALTKNDTIRCLGLNESNFGIRPPSNATIAESALNKILMNSKTLLHLSIANCDISSTSMLEIIEEGLSFNASLQRLNISGNNLSPQVGIRLGSYLLEPIKEKIIPEDAEDPDSEYEIIATTLVPKLFYLDASNNPFGDQVASAFVSTLVTYPYLGYLDLSSCELGDKGALAFAEILSGNQSLVELHLANNGFTSYGGVEIANSLKKNTVLVTLNISKNKLGDETAAVLAEALECNSTLTTLNISGGMISNNGGVQIAAATQKCPNLTNLDMSNNFFTEAAGSVMERTFKDNTTILKINVSGTQINHFSFHALNQICIRNQELLRQKEERPLRNKVVKSQYSIIELQRKERILYALNCQKDELQAQIDMMNARIAENRGEEEQASLILTKQIAEKEQQMEHEKVEFQAKMEDISAQIKETVEKKNAVQEQLEHQQKKNAEVHSQYEARKAELAKLHETFEAEKAAILSQIDAISKAADDLDELSRDTEKLASMKDEELPKFLTFEDDEAESAPKPEEVETKKTTRSSRSSRKKKSSRSPKSSRKKELK